MMILKGETKMKKEEIKKEIKRGEQVHTKKDEPKPTKDMRPLNLEKVRINHKEDLKPNLPKKEKLENELNHEEKPKLLTPQEKLEVMINLCGNKKELKEMLININGLVIDAPKQIKTEIKVKKLK